MRMKVICGDPDCREEFFVESTDPVWECPECGREITNKHYPFLTAKLMQAKIDGDSADWRMVYSDLLDLVEAQVSSRLKGREGKADLSFIDEAKKIRSSKGRKSNAKWRELHDELLKKGREAVLALDAEAPS